MALKPLMVAGTASNVGKSILATAFCRIFKQDGFNPAPFKAQNMSLNSYATPEGLEIGRAQAAQAEAAGIPCHTDMNPVLLKPSSHTASQIILHGKPAGSQTAYEYFRKEGKLKLFEEVKTAYNRLASKHNPIIIEGAGSIAEMNLKDRDIVNMRMALHADASVLLVADIDRGGVFASAYGSVKLLPENERKLIKGILVNKFRGDRRLFDEGVKILEDITEVPVLGVIPHMTGIDIDEEDSVSLEEKNTKPVPGKINVAVIRLPRLSNHTDFKMLENIPEVNVYYAFTPQAIAQADIIIIPGSKNTLEDLQALYDAGIAGVLQESRIQGKTIIGICGGYQMLGQDVNDPHGVESQHKTIAGLGLLPVSTTLATTKQTVQKRFYHGNNRQAICQGYEIHMGVTTPTAGITPANFFDDGSPEGCYLDEHCWGTYIHGVFDNIAVLQQLFRNYPVTLPTQSYRAYKEQQYDALATFVRNAVNMEKIYNILQPA